VSTAPVFNIDLESFWADPYPVLQRLRAEAPIAYVPQLGATLMCKRDDIFVNEKKVDTFSSDQPGGLMTLLMGQNLMRKDGEPHQIEKRAIFPSVSPRTVKEVWRYQFMRDAERIIGEIQSLGEGDLVRDFATRLSADALRHITGLTNMEYTEMDRVSQGMIAGVSNYGGHLEIEANCLDCTASIDAHIDEMLTIRRDQPNQSLLSAQLQAGLSEQQIKANVKLAISGGQNEPRDAIAGTIWALLMHPEQLRLVQSGEASWLKAFEEYARWIAPVGMSPRRIAKTFEYGGVSFELGDLVFLMFGSGNRDEDVFESPELFDVTRDTSPSITFGSGPHRCAGAWISRTLIAEVALPQAFCRLKNLSLEGEVPFGGWAFRGPLALPCQWE